MNVPVGPPAEQDRRPIERCGWTGHLTVANAAAVGERLALIMRDRFATFNIRSNNGWRPEVRTSLQLVGDAVGVLFHRDAGTGRLVADVRWADGDQIYSLTTDATSYDDAAARLSPVLHFRQDHVGDQVWISQVTGADGRWEIVIALEDHQEA